MKIQPGKEQEYLTWKQINSQDPYSLGVVRYAEAWAELMEQRFANGERPEDFVQATSREADTEGITGFMYGCAISALANFWVHGDPLRRWHNLKTQIGTEGEEANKTGGTLNPALLCVKAK
jgi:hypothetical protein